jgi:soluble lytic murein transglycosylase-like protein
MQLRLFVVSCAIGVVASIGILSKNQEVHVRQEIPIALSQPVFSHHPNNLTLVSAILDRYKHVDDDLIHDVVFYSHKYARPDFPKQADILAMIATESSFNPKAVSKLKRDPAIGLTQIRPGAWRHKIKRHELNDVENQIKYGAEILAHNYKKLQDKHLALHAYNLGLTSVLRGQRSKTYVVKFERELKALTRENS